MKLGSIFILIMMVVIGCRPAKKVQKIQEAISKKDTTSVIVVKDNNGVDSAALIHQVYNKVIKNKIEFNTFSAKVRVSYEGKEGGDEATAFIRLKKDSAIWLSLRGALGIEGFRVTDNKRQCEGDEPAERKMFSFRSISYLQDITDLPFDFTTLQDLIIGQPHIY